jgi:glycosyltransferase involved in cell wall biosynthesis
VSSSSSEDLAAEPGVTVVVPTVDRPELLARAVRSVLAQDYAGDIECLVVFDGTEPVVPDVSVPPGRTLRVLSNTRRKGLAGNRNTGYLAGTMPLIATCDDDDEWLPGKLRAQVAAMARTPGAMAAVCGMIVQRHGRETVRQAPDGLLTLPDLLRDRHAAIPSDSILFRRALLEQGFLVDEDLPGAYGEDYEWLLRVARASVIVSIPDALVRVDFHDNSLFVSQWRTIQQALTYLLERYPEFAGEPAGLARIEGQLAFAHAALGERRAALRLAAQALRRSRRPRQPYAAVAVALGVVSADRVVAAARRVGRGI